MQCILIGVTPPDSDDDNNDDPSLWNTITQTVTEVNGHALNWIATSNAHDEGKLTQLLSATTASDVPVDDVVAATGNALGDSYFCELWASAPAILPLRPLNLNNGYGYGYDKHLNVHDKAKADPGVNTINNNSWEECAASTMKEWGMFVQSSLIDKCEVEELRQCVNEEIASIEELITLHRPDVNIGKDVMSFREIASRGNERFDLLLQESTSSSNSKARDFVEQIILERISPTIENILGGNLNSNNGDVNFDISVVYSKPGAPNQGWHADGEHQKGAQDAGWDYHTTDNNNNNNNNGWKKKNQLAEPYALCLFIPLIDLDDTTGYTQFWPASHRNRGLMGFGPVAELTESVWNGTCRAGDAIWYDYRLMHRGMGNSSQLLRPVVQVLFKKSWYVERRNYGTESVRK